MNFINSKKDIGYTIKTHETKTERLCMLTIGSIIIFNGRKQIVTHTYGHRTYKNIKGKNVDVTLGYSGFLKDIETGLEQRSNWQNTTKDKILHFEHLDVVSI
jgi:hypothetical protein